MTGRHILLVAHPLVNTVYVMVQKSQLVTSLADRRVNQKSNSNTGGFGPSVKSTFSLLSLHATTSSFATPTSFFIAGRYSVNSPSRTPFSHVPSIFVPFR